MSPIEARIRERHAIVHALLHQGHGIREIARELHIGGNTVRRCARAATPEELLGGRRQSRPSQLDPYKSHLDKRWAEGITNAIQLHSELQSLGYRGSYQIISHYLRPRRRRRIRVVGPRHQDSGKSPGGSCVTPTDSRKARENSWPKSLPVARSSRRLTVSSAASLPSSQPAPAST
ncbi:hypothetical protein ACH475_34410 [Streptomyces globisporus]|uniref:hypothetical protein n=1 Tax=Streptomyces globisporus TaxID=1908 RepID=UPI0037B770C3